MRSKFTRTVSFALIVGAFLLSGHLKAQVQLNLTGNHFSPIESGSKFSDGFWGGGATLRYFISPKFAVGLNGRYFTRSESTAFNGGTASVKAAVVIVTGQAEYFFTESALRPYVGLESGLYHSSLSVDVPGLISDSESFNDFGVAPKVGLQYLISPGFGLNVDAGYHLIFSDGETSKSLLLGAGVFFTFGQN